MGEQKRRKRRGAIIVIPVLVDDTGHHPDCSDHPRADRPARISTPAYREGWDNIFGAPKQDAMVN